MNYSEKDDFGKKIIFYHFVIKLFIPAVLIFSVGWMSYSRIGNIKETFKASLVNETKYELIDNIEFNDQIQLKNILGFNVLVYDGENKPVELVETKDLTSKEDYMYALSSKSDILKMEEDGFKGFWWDLCIVSIVLIFIYKIFLFYSKDLIDSYRKIKEQLSRFHLAIHGKWDKSPTIENFINKYDSILREIKQIDYIGKIWWEFCETLIIKREEDVDNPNEYCENNPIVKLKNTDQIEVYINSEVIIDKQIQKEVLDVIPGILTGLGLVGTFLAIAVALMGFDMGHIELSIQNLLGGLSIKFISSLAGIVTSIMFLYMKSRLFSNIELNIYDEQHLLNSIFPRRTTESYLCHIWEEIEASNEKIDTLNKYAKVQEERAQNFIDELGTKITTILQNNVQEDIKEVLNDLSTTISNSISGNLKETLEKLIVIMEDVKETKAASAKTITSSLMKSGAMEEASKVFAGEVNESVTKLSEQNEKFDTLVQSVGAYVEQLHSYESTVENHYKELLGNLSNALNTQVDFVNKNSEYVKNIEVASNKISSTSSNLDTASERLSEVSSNFQQAASNTSEMMEVSGSIVNNTKEINNNIETILNQFRESAEKEVSNLFSQYTKSVQDICGNIQSAVGELEDVDFDELKESIDRLSEIVKEKYGK